ncbi:acyl-CoA dehydrogenase family protein [Streptomyces sp. NPDC051018]|uniref:acyl-CoA dehydrogenase family protein n=1 Tax=Streptomyces sp. NPDC051018 TaxID=3365639 RepID=UPI0037A1DC71
MTTGFLTEDHHHLREQVREFTEAEVVPRAEAMDESGAVDHDLARLIAVQGWIGVTIPSGYGGMDAGQVAKTVVIHELSKSSAAAGAIAQASMLGAAGLIYLGTAEQKAEWLPAVANGTVLPTIAVTEEESGGHVLGMRSTARRVSKKWWEITGRKVHIGNSHVGHVHTVVARTGDGPNGLTAFLVEHDRPGLTLPEHRPAMGLRGFSMGELHLDRVRVPAANILGGIGGGLTYAYSSSILYGRPNLTAVALGTIDAALHDTTVFARERRRYGKPLADLPGVRSKVARMEAIARTARLAAYHAVRRLDLGEACDMNLIHAKLTAVTSAIDTTRLALDVHGAAGLRLPVARYYRDAPCLVPPAGTSDIQLHRLAEHVLGPRRPDWSATFATPHRGIAPAA